MARKRARAARGLAAASESAPQAGGPSAGRRVEIRQRRSAIGEKAGARRTLVALGLRRTDQRVAHDDTPSLRGMLRRVAHLVDVTEVRS